MTILIENYNRINLRDFPGGGGTPRPPSITGGVGQGSRATIFAESADWIPYIFSFIDFGRY